MEKRNLLRKQQKWQVQLRKIGSHHICKGGKQEVELSCKWKGSKCGRIILRRRTWYHCNVRNIRHTIGKVLSLSLTHSFYSLFCFKASMRKWEICQELWILRNNVRERGGGFVRREDEIFEITKDGSRREGGRG